MAFKNNKNRRAEEFLKIIPIGGLKEIGKNMTILEYNGQIIIVDCGLSFPEDEMLGIDIVIPDFDYLIQNSEKIKGLIVTHGHEDHIGAIPYLLKELSVELYGTKLSLGLVSNKLKEHKLSCIANVIEAGQKFSIGDFEIEAVRATHSIADAVSYYIKTPAATVFHTGDFKIDFTPIDGDPMDLSRLADIGRKGVDIMLADSTNALRPGFTKSEQLVGETLDGIIREAESRIIIATFSSNVHRVQKIVELAVKYGRKVTVSGRSMENVVRLASELGYLNIPEGAYVDLKKAKNIPDKELVIITTGSQGEPMAALSRMANDEHRNVKLKKGDMVIFSSTPVPGNEKTVSGVVNTLYEKGVKVIYHDIADIHVSGHACQEELKIMHSLIKPKMFMPVHGEYRHLVKHSQIAEELGMKNENIFFLSNGDQLSVNKRGAKKFANVAKADDILVDGLGVGDVGNAVLKERKQLSEAGLMVIAVGFDPGTGYIFHGPEIITKGFVYVKENEKLLSETRDKALEIIEKTLMTNPRADVNAVSNALREQLRSFIFLKTKRSPMIIPVFIDYE